MERTPAQGLDGGRVRALGSALLRRIRSRPWRRWAFGFGTAGRHVYYRFMSSAYSREQAAVAEGLRTHARNARQDREVFLLRRQVHMLEKGLTMRPRRTTFAVDYIRHTVDLWTRMMLDAALSPSDAEWAHDVLCEYFDATQASGNKTIATARRRFESGRHSHGPSGIGLRAAPIPTAIGEPPVSIDSLLELVGRRSSVRWYEPRFVPRSIVDRAVEAASESPTACNRQPYRFLIFDDPSDAQRLATLPLGTKGYAHQVRAIIAVVGDLSAFFDERDRHLIYVDSMLATMSLILGFEAQGVATCCINWPDIAKLDRQMSALLGLKDHERTVMLLAYGFADPASNVPFSAKRDIYQIRSFEALLR